MQIAPGKTAFKEVNKERNFNKERNVKHLLQY